MNFFNPARITHIYKDKDALTGLAADGCILLYTGTKMHPVIPEFVVLEPKHLKDFDC